MLAAGFVLIVFAAILAWIVVDGLRTGSVVPFWTRAVERLSG